MKLRLAALVTLCAVSAVTTAAQEENWVSVGGYGIGAGLAGPAGGVVEDVSFSVDGRTLLVLTSSGKTWASVDGGEAWAAAPEEVGPLVSVPAESDVAAPEPGARVVRHPYRGGVLFALGRDLYLSPDDGESWISLTAGESPLIGVGQLSIAFDPFEADRIYVANAFGLWRSSDGGITWYGLNERLPNFPNVRFEPGPRGAPPRLASPQIGVAELAIGFGRWRRAPIDATTTSAIPPDFPGEAAGAWVDPANPDIALVVTAESTGSRIFRTLNGGGLWDDLTADLPAGAVRAVTASGETGAIYAAVDAGVYYAAADLRNPAPPTGWTSVTGSLPSALIDDLYLEPASGRLYAAVSGYGVFRRRAPDVLGRLRALNAADLSTRPLAPGGLVTVQGAAVGAARVEGAPAPVLASSATEAQIQIPFRTTGSEVQLELTTADGDHQLSLPFQQVSPAIFVDRGEPLVLSAETGRLLDLTRPARGGDRLLILATGLGQVTPLWPAGLPAPLENPPSTVAAVGAKLNGEPLRVISSALAGGYVGAYLVELELPVSLNAGFAELELEAGGRTSNAVRLFVSP